MQNERPAVKTEGAGLISATCPPQAVEKEKGPIAWSDLGAHATQQAKGDALKVWAEGDGARLRCTFQKLEGEATPTGLWLSSTATGGKADRFMVRASAVGRGEVSGVGFQVSGREEQTLPARGTVSVTDDLVRWVRAGVVEEYSVSVDGVRQDFVLAERPEGEGRLRVALDVVGGRVEPAAEGARIVLAASGRKLAYSRLRVMV